MTTLFSLLVTCELPLHALNMSSAATLEEIAADYFGSISDLSRRLVQDCEAVRAANSMLWPDLTWEEQEQLLDEHFIDARITEKYAGNQSAAGAGSELPSCFPVLKINCGEKIVIDFEHEDVSRASLCRA